MFELVFNDSICISLKSQFETFLKEGGKLPSFSVCVQKLTGDIPKKLTEENQVGDYTFYVKNENSHWFSFCGSYCCLSADMTKADVYISENVRSDGQYEVSYLLMQAYMYRLVSAGGFMIHSAAVNYRNNAILFCGLSGAWKSTQANLWQKYLNVKMLNFDKPCVLSDCGEIYAHGSPWSGKEALYLNEYAPLKAIVFVKQSKNNRAVRLSPAQAFANIYLHNYVYPLTDKIEKKYTSVINDAVKRVPVYELYCDISEEAVSVLYDTLFPEKVYSEVKKENAMKYRIKDCFEMKQIADEFVVIPRGASALDFNATVVFNESGALLWNKLVNTADEEELIGALIGKYSIDRALAERDVSAFLKKMLENGMTEIVE